MTLGQDAFLGDWLVTREIADKAGGVPGRFTGEARFAAAPWGLSYEETGRLQLGAGPAMTATRAYRWIFVPGGVEVFFADGRFFHAFRFDAAEASHLCGDDLYRVRYDFGGWPVWVARWDVQGPRKDYAMVSQYQRP